MYFRFTSTPRGAPQKYLFIENSKDEKGNNSNKINDESNHSKKSHNAWIATRLEVLFHIDSFKIFE
jgi:hypothetical protein